MSSNDLKFEDKDLNSLFKMADEIGNKYYHKLTHQDFQEYLEYDNWRYINGKFDCGTTDESKAWVKDNSSSCCPICDMKYDSYDKYKTIDHKLPRSQYPWLSMNFDNLWVICKSCNTEKGTLNWFEYEQYIYVNLPHQYSQVRLARPSKLIRSLKQINITDFNVDNSN